MNIKTNYLLKAFLLTSFFLPGLSGYGQTKEAALTTLKGIFAERFIKTAVYKIGEADDNLKLQYDKTPSYYDYEITEKYIIISKKNEAEKDKRTVIPIDVINNLFIVESGFFKKSGALELKSKGPNFELTWGADKYTTAVCYFPFSILKDDLAVHSTMVAAINVLSREIKSVIKKDKEIAKSAQQKLDDENQLALDRKLNGTFLPPFKVFTFDSLTVTLSAHIEQNRPFKNKPTLLITWSNEWCNICIKKIDTLLNNGLALKYNIILINKELAKTNFSKLKTKILTHSPNYNKDAILLFDRNSQLEPIDKNSAPFFLWLDKNLKIVKAYPGYSINTTTINNMLLQIDQIN